MLEEKLSCWYHAGVPGAAATFSVLGGLIAAAVVYNRAVYAGLDCAGMKLSIRPTYPIFRGGIMDLRRQRLESRGISVGWRPWHTWREKKKKWIKECVCWVGFRRGLKIVENCVGKFFNPAGRHARSRSVDQIVLKWKSMHSVLFLHWCPQAYPCMSLYFIQHPSFFVDGFRASHGNDVSFTLMNLSYLTSTRLSLGSLTRQLCSSSAILPVRI